MLRKTTLQKVTITLPVRITQYRKAAGLSQRQASIRAGIAQPEWVRFESGKRVPNIFRLVMIADALGQPPRAFLP